MHIYKSTSIIDISILEENREIEDALSAYILESLGFRSQRMQSRNKSYMSSST